VVEVDGASHNRREAADERRDRALERLGYRVLRLPNECAERDIEAAALRVREALRAS
jgi:very-short-patch-repair endonuclease